MNLLKDKTIWITGGAKGIGASLSKSLLEKQAHVIATGSHNLDYYIDNNYLSKIIYQDSNFLFIQCDNRNYYEVEKVYTEIIEKHNKIDILINNAGITLFKPFEKTSIEEYDNLIKINLNGIFYCIKVVIDNMIKNQSGTIVNISSVGAFENFANCSIYNLSKAGLLALSRSLRNEYRNYGIKFIDILPGATDTDAWDSNSRIKYSQRLLKPDSVANAIVSALNNSYDGNTVIEELIIRPIQGNI